MKELKISVFVTYFWKKYYHITKSQNKWAHQPKNAIKGSKCIIQRVIYAAWVCVCVYSLQDLVRVCWTSWWQNPEGAENLLD